MTKKALQKLSRDRARQVVRLDPYSTRVECEPLMGSSKLYAYIVGAGSIFDLGGTTMPKSKVGNLRTDAKALKSDVEVVGRNLTKVFQHERGRLPK